MPKSCPQCNGTGRQMCPNCGGSGSIYVPGQGVQECKACQGARYIDCSGPGPH